VAPGNHASLSQASGGVTALGQTSLALGLTALPCHCVGLLAVVATVCSNGFVDGPLVGAAGVGCGAILSLTGLVLGAVAWYSGKGPGAAVTLGCLVSGAPLGVFLLAWLLGRPPATDRAPAPPAHDFIMPWER
jgi:hypothetical protein